MSGLFGANKVEKEAPVVSSLRVSTSNYGRAIPLGWGKFKVASWCLWYDDFNTVAYEDDTVSGGKGGSTPTQLKYRYEAAIIFGICEGPMNDSGSVWKGKEYLVGEGTTTKTFSKSEFVVPSVLNSGACVLDAPATVIAIQTVVAQNSGWQEGPPDPVNPSFYSLSGNTITFLPGMEGLVYQVVYTYSQTFAPQSPFDQANLTLFKGDYSQAAWSYVTTNHSTEALAYRGICYAASPAYDLGSDTSVPNTSFEVDSIFGYSLTVRDVNPKDFLVDFLTNSYYGANFTLRGLADWSDYSTYCIANGLFLSPEYTEQESAAQILERVMAITNSDMVYADKKLEIVPYADQVVQGNGKTWTPVLTAAYSLTVDDFLPNGDGGPIKIRRKSPNERYNQLRLKFRNRATQYNDDIYEAKDEAEIGKYGLRASPYERETPEVKLRDVAATVGSLLVQRMVNICNTYSFKLPFRYALLKPMALLALTYAPLELSGQLVRVVKISEQNSDGDLEVEAEEVPVGTASSILYPTQAPAGASVDVNVAPGSVDTPVLFEAPAFKTLTGLKVYAAVRGSNANWGGAQMWASLDGTTYRRIGTIRAKSRYGALSAAAGAAAASILINGCGDSQLLGGTSAEAIALATLCYVGGANPEYFAYTTATLTGAGAYTLGGIVHGAFNSPALSHASGTPFVRVDNRIAETEDLDPSLVGETLYFKFCSFNVYGGGLQDLADATAYTYTLTGAGLTLQAPITADQLVPGASVVRYQGTDAGPYTFSAASGSEKAGVSFVLDGKEVGVFVFASVDTKVLLSTTGTKYVAGTWEIRLGGASYAVQPFSLEVVPGGNVDSLVPVFVFRYFTGLAAGSHTASLRYSQSAQAGANTTDNITNIVVNVEVLRR